MFQESFSSSSGGEFSSQGGFSSGGSMGFSSSSGGSAGFSSSSSGGAAGFSSSSGSSAGGSAAYSQIAQDLMELARSGSAGGASMSAGGASMSAGGASLSIGGGASMSQSASFGGSASSGASASASGSAGGAAFLSQIESSILRSTVPIDVNETEEISVAWKGAQERGVWANKAEIINWKGEIAIDQYIIHEDMNPEVITKRTEQALVYIQELAIRYLRPPTPPAPGEIVITTEANSLAAPAPPLVIRQMPARADTPEPMVVREAPPEAPKPVGRKMITIGGKQAPPPPRKVVIERLAPLPSKPQSVMVERWLPYSEVKRRVIFQRNAEADAVVVNPRNVIVQWEAPQVEIKKEFKYLGVIRANPVEYVQKYGASLKISREMPDFVSEFKTPDGLVLAADFESKSFYELEGEVKAMALVDLDAESLSEYKQWLSGQGVSYVGKAGVVAAAAAYQSSGASASFGASSSSSGGASASFGASSSSSGGASASFGASGSSSSSSSSGGASKAVLQQIFSSIDVNGNGFVSTGEAAMTLLRLNSSLGRSYGQVEAEAFFKALDTTNAGKINFEQFAVAFNRIM